MTVYIHPKDQGPIDTANKDRCGNCEETVMRNGGAIYKTETRPSDRRKSYKSTYLGVCPYCKESMKYHGESRKCLECKTYFDLLDAPNASMRNRETLCPMCKVELTEDNCRDV